MRQRPRAPRLKMLARNYYVVLLEFKQYRAGVVQGDCIEQALSNWDQDNASVVVAEEWVDDEYVGAYIAGPFGLQKAKQVGVEEIHSVGRPVVHTSGGILQVAESAEGG